MPRPAATTATALLLLALALPLPLPAQATEQADPLHSVMWETVRDSLFPGAPLVFDPRVQVLAPAWVEDNLSVPVSVRVDGLGQVEEVVVLADHNPIPEALRFRPLLAAPDFDTHIKVQEATPIRAAVRTADGVWHVGGRRVEAVGGGCTTPSATQASRQWETDLNRVSARLWHRSDGGTRLRLRLIHPMDTGLIAGIPAFYLEELRVLRPDGTLVAEIAPREPVSENPVFTLDLAPGVGNGGLLLAGRDNQGNELAARVAPPAATDILSPLPDHQP